MKYVHLNGVSRWIFEQGCVLFERFLEAKIGLCVQSKDVGRGVQESPPFILHLHPHRIEYASPIIIILYLLCIVFIVSNFQR